MATPSPGYAITVRVETPSSSGATSGLVAAVSTAKGVLTALDVVESHADRLVVDVTCNASDAEHADMIVAELAEVLAGADVFIGVSAPGLLLSLIHI